ncbi:MAG: carbohydrate kinase, partial [Bacteroidetes bacterium]|nr:carbohydrate kinase [Bacteroidota bacterium]
MNKKVVCFGEILWDMLPTGKVAGGAPMNVAVHLHNFGIPAEMISKAGNDTLGGALIEFLKEKGVNTQYIQRDYSHPTGTVNVNLSDRSEVIYEIVEPAAWDFIDFSESLKTLIQEADVFIFGSLCARNEQTRKTLFDLLDQAKLKIFDVNFRPPHY